MFQISVLIGFFSYVLFFLGVTGLFYKNLITVITIAFALTVFLSFFAEIKKFFLDFKIPSLPFFRIVLGIIIFQALINFLGSLGPEIGFDALWYHLTLPKLFLQEHKVFSTGGILYYSPLPKLTEMLYASALSFNSEILAKVIHFFFGILTTILVYKISKKFFNEKISILCSLAFYSNLVVGWESVSAYVDLARAFFEANFFLAIVLWYKSNRDKFLYLSAIFLGFEICTKLVSLEILPLVLAFIIFYLLRKKQTKKAFTQTLLFFIISILIPMPWFIYSFFKTGNPFFPFFSNAIHFPIQGLIPISFLLGIFEILLYSPDPISPVYLVIIPLIFYKFGKMNIFFKTLSFYVVINLLFTIPYYWEGSRARLFLPFLVEFSVLVGFVLKEIKNTFIKNSIISLILVCSIVSIIYRSAANSKYIPYLLRRESKASFLAKNLNFSFGDFYDTDGFFARNIESKDKVLLLGFHNIFYVDFPFTLDQNDKYDYVAIQNSSVPTTFKFWKKIYSNSLTKVVLYEKN